MPLSVLVQNNEGVRLGIMDRFDVDRLCDAAAELGLPLLGNIDRYDDTIFNRLQISLLRKELVNLAEQTDCDPEAVFELNRLFQLVDERPHRYLVFSGD